MTNLELGLVVLNGMLLGAFLVGLLIIAVDWKARKTVRQELEVLRDEFKLILAKARDLNNANAETIVKLGDRVQAHDMILKGVGKK